MQYKLSCEQVSALINFYLEGVLSDTLKKYVKKHLEECPYCNEKYNKIKSAFDNYVEINSNNNESIYYTKQYEDFRSNLSAYIDNELDIAENIKIKKIAISNPLARQDLENIYTYKKLLKDSYEKTKNELRDDYSKNIVCKIKNNCKNSIDKFYKICAIFIAMISCIICGTIIFLYL